MFRWRIASGGCPRGMATARTDEKKKMVVCQYEWRAPNRLLMIQDSVDPREAKVFRAHVVPQGLCDNLINSLKLLTKPEEKRWQPG